MFVRSGTVSRAPCVSGNARIPGRNTQLELKLDSAQAGDFRGELLQFDFGDFLFTRGKFNLPFRQRDGAPDSPLTFALMTDTSLPALWRNREIPDEAAVMILPPRLRGRCGI